MKIAVIVVNWNAGDQLRACVESVLRQSYPTAHLVVVDNASSDDSMDQIPCDDARITLIRNQSNLGFAAANNQAVALVEECDWIALLNPDAVADRDWLAELAAGVERNPAVSAFASRMMAMNEEGMLDGAGDNYHIFGFAWRRFHNRALNSVPAEIDTKVFGACGGAALYRRQVFVELQGFDSSFFCYMEDVDLAFRMQLRGYECVYLHRALVRHLGGGTTDGKSGFAEFYGHRNLIWTYFKNMPTPLLVLFLPGHIVANIVMVVHAARGGKAGVVWKAKRHGLGGCPALLEKRRSIQCQRKVSLLTLWQIFSKGLVRR